VPERERGHVYHLFVIRTSERAALERHLRARGIETLVHYPTPIPRQPMFSQAPADASATATTATAAAVCPRADLACGQVLSLPLHPALTADDVDRVCSAIADFRP
jgi:dTDP-4-amino-4,6-dideoxygalactose transaminase